ncbi:MAG: tricarballylate utilization 4Fe-4S protein TcuB [Burkholderiales bacterium]|nr:tricarballylate utilization 4Fe-4S protein TcuB [Burkholderiales bacterium]
MSAPSGDLHQEGARQMGICNSCRYCEGYCAVFPAMERRLAFERAELEYLANRCHGCNECYYACQYAPPHEFAISLPKMLGEVRAASWRSHAWPAPLARSFERGGLVAALALAFGLAAILALAAALGGGGASLLAARAGGDFYAVIPHGVMAGLFGAVGVFVLAALVAGLLSFWRASGEALAGFARAHALAGALKDALSLKYLDGNGAVGCTYPGERSSQARRWFHHLSFYGFLLCFAATVTGTVYHYGFGWVAPYGYASLPVLLGTAGGLGLIAGPAGLAWLKLRRDPATANPEQTGMDTAFLALLVLASLSGLALLAWRETAAMALLLCAHLGVVLALFLVLPCGRFVHGVYRFAALAKYALEQRRPGLDPGRE